MPEEKSCDACPSGFNFCFWAKLLVAIPAIPIIGIAAASFFTSPPVQIAVGGTAAFVAMYIAAKIDKMPLFSGMVVKKK